MTGTNLQSAYLTGTKITGETLKGSVLCKTIIPFGQRDYSGY